MPITNSDNFTALSSSRLIVRRFTDGDLHSFLAYRNDPEVARYQDWTSYTDEEAITFIEEMKNAPCGAPEIGFQFAIELKATGSLIGDCYLKVENEEPRHAEIGFTLARAYQKQGYATEAVSLLLDYVFDELNLHRVAAITDCRNTASVALLERLGMRSKGHFVQNTWFKGSWSDEYWYGILKDEWRNNPRKA